MAVPILIPLKASISIATIRPLISVSFIFGYLMANNWSLLIRVFHFFVRVGYFRVMIKFSEEKINHLLSIYVISLQNVNNY